MDENQRIDARDVREGGWAWYQNELLYVFRPLVGANAAWLYTVLCHLIPQAIENPLMELSMRAIAKASGQSPATVYRNLRLLIQMGMIEEARGSKGRPSTFSLVSLRKLAALGSDELKRRRSVSVRNTLPDDEQDESSEAEMLGDAETPTDGEDKRSGELASASEAPGASGGASVSHRNTHPAGAKDGDTDVENEDPANQVFQKRGGSVSEKGGKCFKNPGEVFHQDAPLIKSIYLESKTSPLPPVPGGDAPECSSEPPEFATALEAAAWVKRRCGITSRRFENLVAPQLELRCADAGESLSQAAALAVTNYGMYQGHVSRDELRFVYGPAKLFGLGLWHSPETWPYDHDKIKQRLRAAEGLAWPHAPAVARQRLDKRPAEWIRKNAAQFDGADGLGKFGDELRTLADGITSDQPLDTIDRQLVEVEDRVYAAALQKISAEEMAELHKATEQKLAPMRGRVNAVQWKQLLDGMLYRLVFERLHLPRLSVFYMST